MKNQIKYYKNESRSQVFALRDGKKMFVEDDEMFAYKEATYEQRLIDEGFYVECSKEQFIKARQDFISTFVQDFNSVTEQIKKHG